jgi:hypothetical protein
MPVDPLAFSVDSWLAAATENASKRGLPELVPILESLREPTLALRAADWNEEAGVPEVHEAPGRIEG